MVKAGVPRDTAIWVGTDRWAIQAIGAQDRGQEATTHIPDGIVVLERTTTGVDLVVRVGVPRDTAIWEGTDRWAILPTGAQDREQEATTHMPDGIVVLERTTTGADLVVRAGVPRDTAIWEGTDRWAIRPTGAQDLDQDVRAMIRPITLLGNIAGATAGLTGHIQLLALTSTS